MHSDIKRGLAMLGAAGQFEIDHPSLPPNARAALLFGEVRTAAGDIHAMGGTQDFSRGRFRSGASERRSIAATMRALMRQIARVAKVLDPKEYPGAREKLMVPRSNGYHPLLTRASVFLETLPGIKTAFIERGMPANFDVRLQGLIEQFEAATKRKVSGLYTQVGSTAAMKARLREAVRVVRELDVILSLLLEDDPALYAAWRSASHIERAPRRSGNGEAESIHPAAQSTDAALPLANSAASIPSQAFPPDGVGTLHGDDGSPPNPPVS